MRAHDVNLSSRHFRFCHQDRWHPTPARALTGLKFVAA